MSNRSNKALELKEMFRNVGAALVGTSADDVISVKANPESVSVKYLTKYGVSTAVLYWSSIDGAGDES